jgi:hypothetical protein
MALFMADVMSPLQATLRVAAHEGDAKKAATPSAATADIRVSDR